MQQRLGIMDQLNGVVFFVAIDRQLQCFNAARTSGNQWNHRTAKTSGEGVDIDTDLLFLSNIQHVQCDDAGNTQLKQLQRQVEVAFKV